MASIKKKSSGGGGANWMDTYGDMVTLLLCFFVLLYSISSLDEQKWMLVVQSFNNKSIVNTDELPTGPEGDSGQEGGDDMPATDMVETALDELFQFLQSQAAANDSISVSQGDGYVFISFSDAVFFEGDKSNLLPAGRTTLDSIIPALEQAGPFIDEVRVLGHTAQANPNRPNTIRGDRTLSSDRATEVLIYIMEHADQDKLDPASFVAMAYGQWRPVASNEDESTRYQNRRVEMLITGRNVEENLVGNIRQYYTETGQEDDMPSSAEMGDIPNSTEGSSS